MAKKILFIVSTILLSISAVFAFAYWDDLLIEENESITLGEWRTIEISTPQEFYDMVNAGSNPYITYRLTQDIDFSGFTWNYDSSMDSNVFDGILDGADYTIRNLTVTSADTNSRYLSIFSQLDGAVIKDLNVENYHMGFSSTYLSSSNNLQSSLFAGNVMGSGNIIENINANNINIAANDKDATGGLVSQVSGGAELTIKNVKATDITVLNVERRVGGLIGRTLNNGTSVTVEDVEIEGQLASGYSNSNVGGIIGTSLDTPLTIDRAIIEFTAAATIQLTDGPYSITSNKNVGGFIGQNNNDTAVGNVITNGFFTGELYSNTSRIATAVGRNNSNTTTLNDVYYSNVLFNTTYTEPTGARTLHATLVNATSMPDNTWWNNFATDFNNGLWTQDATGRLTLIG